MISERTHMRLDAARKARDEETCQHIYAEFDPTRAATVCVNCRKVLRVIPNEAEQ